MPQILVVDDSAFTRATLTALVKALGYDVVEATNGDEALELVSSTSPDAIVLDLLMPGKDGFEVLKELHAKESTIPIIVLTADIQETSKEKCADLGVVAFLNKPIQQEEVRAALATALAEEAS